jgi:hypothetical protein
MFRHILGILQLLIYHTDDINLLFILLSFSFLYCVSILNFFVIFNFTLNNFLLIIAITVVLFNVVLIITKLMRICV